jgi:hypothetical protein
MTVSNPDRKHSVKNWRIKPQLLSNFSSIEPGNVHGKTQIYDFVVIIRKAAGMILITIGK